MGDDVFQWLILIAILGIMLFVSWFTDDRKF